MHKGDISNNLVSKLIYVVWEGMVAVPGERYSPRAFNLRGTFLTPRLALDLYVTNQLCVDQLWELWGMDQGIAIVTYMPPRYLQAVYERIAKDNIPNCRFIATTVNDMSHRIATESECMYIVDADPMRRLTYGPKGRYIEPAYAQMIGRV